MSTQIGARGKGFSLVLLMIALVLLAGCGGGQTANTRSYLVKFTVSGLVGLNQLVMANGNDRVTVQVNGDYQFPTPVKNGETYFVTVSQQPTNRFCQVQNFSGKINRADTSNILVVCGTNQGSTVSVNVTGMNNVVSQMTRTMRIAHERGSAANPTNPSYTQIDTIEVNSDGLKNFNAKVASGTQYIHRLRVVQQPLVSSDANFVCSILNPEPLNANSTQAYAVTCNTGQLINISVNGLSGANGNLVIKDNVGGEVSISSFQTQATMPVRVARNINHSISVKTYPTDRNCTIQTSSQNVGNFDINYSVSCTVGNPPQTPNTGTGAVNALYPAAPNWNDYVQNNGNNIFSASGTLCNGTEFNRGYEACLHGGEMRVAEVTNSGVTSCNGITAEDNLKAFVWKCDDSQSGKLRFISVGFQNVRDTSTNPNFPIIVNRPMGLSDLIDWNSETQTGGTQRYQWKLMSLTVRQNSNSILQTQQGRWWTNNIETVPSSFNSTSGIALTQSGTVYVVENANCTSNPVTQYYFNADKIGLVVKDDQVLCGSSNFSSYDFIRIANQKFGWLEGQFKPNNDKAAVMISGSSRYNTLRNVTVSSADEAGIRVVADGNRFENIRAHNTNFLALNEDSGVGVFLENANDNSFVNVFSSNNMGHGIYLKNSKNNSFSGVTSVNNDRSGMKFNLNSSNNIARFLTVINNKGNEHGLAVEGSNNHVRNANVINNDGGVKYRGSNHQLTNLVIANNAYSVTDISIDLMNATNISQSSINGVLKYTGTCTVSPVTGQAPITANCAKTNSSDFPQAIQINASPNTWFYDQLQGRDSINASAGNSNGQNTVSLITDWGRFENAYRTWARESSSAFPSALNRGALTAAQDSLKVWDWRVRSAGGQNLQDNNLVMPSSGTTTVNHAWTSGSVTFLPYAMEIGGNHNGLCESNEVCLYMPSISSFPGEGVYQAQNFADGSISKVSLFRHTNAMAN